MLGAEATYDRVPYFYSDQYEVGLEYVAPKPLWSTKRFPVVRTVAEMKELIAFMRTLRI